MKKNVCLLACLFVCVISFAQQDKDLFSLSLELVNPSGSLHRTSYFQAKLRNKDKKVSMVISWRRSEWGAGTTPTLSYFIQEFERKDGTKIQSDKYPFFVYKYEGQSVLKILPQSFITIEIPLFEENGWDGKYFGILPREMEACKQIKRVRIKLGEMRYSGVFPSEIFGKANLVSNWIDLSNADYSKVLELMTKDTEKTDY